MSLFLKLFNTTAEYNAYTADTSNFILPNVSCAMDDLTTVHYNPIVPPYSGFCKLYLNDGSEVEIQGSGTLALTYEQIKQYYDTCIGIEIGTQCTAIGASAFYYYEEPMSGEFEEYNFENVTKVFIPSGVTSIGADAFYACVSLTSVTIPNSVTTIGNSAFGSCISLTSVNIPSSIISIGSNPFMRCIYLESITVDGNNPIYDSRNNCNAIIKTSTYELVSGCKNTFIPNSVTSIGNNAFLNCSRLTSVTVNAATPPTLGNRALSSTNNCPIYVPSASVNAYKAASNWIGYASRIQAIP